MNPRARRRRVPRVDVKAAANAVVAVVTAVRDPRVIALLLGMLGVAGREEFKSDALDKKAAQMALNNQARIHELEIEQVAMRARQDSLIAQLKKKGVAYYSPPPATQPTSAGPVSVWKRPFFALAGLFHRKGG